VQVTTKVVWSSASTCNSPGFGKLADDRGAIARHTLFYSILFYSILFYSILFYSILFYSILFYSILL
jgi:hypothetical protein